MKRTVRVFRNGSGLVIALPADWVRGLGILTGTQLEMTYSDSDLSVRLPNAGPTVPPTSAQSHPRESAMRRLLKVTRIP